MSKLKKKSVYYWTKGVSALSVSVVMFMFPSTASATTLTEIIKNITEPVTQSETLISAVSYIVGAIFLMIAFVTFRGMSGQQREPGKLAGIILAFVAGVGLLYFPSTIKTGGSTIFGGSEASQSSSGGTLIGK